DRGFLDGATVSDLKRKRRVDVIIPLKANMLATQEAMQLARFGKFHSPRKVDNSFLGRASAYRHCCALSHKSGSGPLLVTVDRWSLAIWRRWRALVTPKAFR